MSPPTKSISASPTRIEMKMHVAGTIGRPMPKISLRPRHGIACSPATPPRPRERLQPPRTGKDSSPTRVESPTTRAIRSIDAAAIVARWRSSALADTPLRRRNVTHSDGKSRLPPCKKLRHLTCAAALLYREQARRRRRQDPSRHGKLAPVRIGIGTNPRACPSTHGASRLQPALFRSSIARNRTSSDCRHRPPPPTRSPLRRRALHPLHLHAAPVSWPRVHFRSVVHDRAEIRRRTRRTTASHSRSGRSPKLVDERPVGRSSRRTCASRRAAPLAAARIRPQCRNELVEPDHANAATVSSMPQRPQNLERSWEAIAKWRAAALEHDLRRAAISRRLPPPWRGSGCPLLGVLASEREMHAAGRAGFRRPERPPGMGPSQSRRRVAKWERGVETCGPPCRRCRRLSPPLFRRPDDLAAAVLAHSAGIPPSVTPAFELVGRGP